MLDIKIVMRAEKGQKKTLAEGQNVHKPWGRKGLVWPKHSKPQKSDKPDKLKPLGP